MQSPYKIPWFERMSLWRDGFKSESSFIYSFEKYGRKAYLSDYKRYLYTPRINGKYSLILNDKLLFSRVLSEYKCFFPENYFLVEKGHIVNFSGNDEKQNIDSVIERLENNKKLVLKPLKGACGKSVHVLSLSDGCLLADNKETSKEEMVQLFAGQKSSLLCEYVFQHPYSAAINPEAVNTIRIVTMWDYSVRQPFIAAAVHRFGVKDTGPVDNFSKGGLCCAVDLEKGVLSKGVSMPRNDGLTWRTVHPESGSALENLVIPFWDMVKTKILQMASDLFFIPYIGWDIAITEDGFRVIEGNNFTDVNLLQVHAPLLLDPRVRAFYHRFGVI